MRTIQDIKLIPIRDYLTHRGAYPKQENSRYGFYLSPLREEQDASFKVDYSQNVWYDFGLGGGGSIIDLVMGLKSVIFNKRWSDYKVATSHPQNLLLRKLCTFCREVCKYRDTIRCTTQLS